MTVNFEAELSVGPKAIDAYSRLSYTMWFALAEFVDNSTQSRYNYDELLNEILIAEGRPLTVAILHNRVTKEIEIEDNSIGMTKDDLIAALRIAHPTTDSKGRSRYGMGMKTAACWIGGLWTVTTCEWGSGEEWTATVDVDAIANNNAKVPLSMRVVGREEHYTRITIRNLRRVIQRRSEETIKLYLGSIYMFDLRPDNNGRVELKLTYNGEEVTAPDDGDWDTDPAGQLMKRDLPTLSIGGRTVTGWIGILRKGGRKYGGFSLFQNQRQIQGFPNAWKPRAIFGGVDEEGANNLVTQRLTGVLHLDGFVVSHTKDAILFENDEEEIIEKFLITETKAYADYAKSRRAPNKVQRWSKEQVRELVNDLHGDFTSPEIQDALNNAALPPPATLAANNQQQFQSLKKEDEIASLDILPDLKVTIWVKEISEWEPHVTYVPGSQGNELHIIINGLHPYYKTLESKDAISECVQQYIFDAVAEFKASKLIQRVYPESVRNIKDALLRTRMVQLTNADEQVRLKAALILFGEDDKPPKSNKHTR
jgi:hypothetical protein